MAVYFFDSSALVKRYAQETGSEWILALTEPAAGHSLYIARITAVEVVSALTRRQRGGSVSETDASTAMVAFRYDLSHQYRVIEITPTVITQAMGWTWPHESGHIWEARSPHPPHHEVGLKPLAHQTLQRA